MLASIVNIVSTTGSGEAELLEGKQALDYAC